MLDKDTIIKGCLWWGALLVAGCLIYQLTDMEYAKPAWTLSKKAQSEIAEILGKA